MVKALENIFGGEPTLTSYEGSGQYTAFIDGGGGGGGYTPPVTPNPIFVPPTYSNEITNNSIRVNLIVENGGEVEFLENGSSKGYGVNNVIVYSPSTTFNGSKKYEVVKNGFRAKEQYVVSITKTYVPAPVEPIKNYDYYYNNYIGINTFGLDNLQNLNVFNWNYNITPTVTAIDYQYSEMVSVQKYVLQSDGSYIAEDTNNFNVGTINLQFSLEANSIVTSPPINIGEQIPAPIEYEVAFSSNFRQELAENVVLTYTIFVNDGTISDSGKLSLLDSNVIRNIESKNLNGRVDFKIEYVNKPAEYSLLNIYQTTNTAKLAEAGTDSIDFTKWNTQNSSFSLPAEQLKSGVSVVVFFEKEISVDRPSITLGTTQYSVQVKDSDLEKEVIIPFNTSNADIVKVYIDGKSEILSTPAANGSVTLYFKKDFSEVYGTKKIVLVAESAKYGTGDSVTGLITFTSVNDFPSITEITFADTIDIPSFSDLNIDLTYEYSSFATSTLDVDLKVNDGSRIALFKNLTPNGNISINLKTLREKFSNWKESDNVVLIFKPFNRGGAEELIGNEYEIKTQLILPSIQIDENLFGTAIFDSFISQLEIIEPEKESKYLTHLANFDNNEQILISTWEADNWTLSNKTTDELGNVFVKDKDKVDSLILKLYSPLTANIATNSTFWITKLMSNPLIETVILTDQADVSCPTIKGPNFSLDIDYVKGQSTNFESLDNIILSGSTSSTELVTTYLSSSIIDTNDLNIEYVSGSTYMWDNFVHFSSAKERVDNFVYKVQLIETYETSISASNASPSSSVLNDVQERERQLIKKNEILKGFDGFEKFLYTSSSLSWPYNNTNRKSSTSNEVANWYDNIITLAEDFDIENSNWVRNNIPQYIVNSSENESLLLFLSMIGHHFDNIYYYTKGIERSRGLGYNSKDISDKLLFDVLKSFNWDAKNLGADSKLWEYAFGLDSDGNEKNKKSAKSRTSEVWRRIANNLPYLLKHKGTRRGVYALLACYGIPSSNLSILEFGGPEVSETTKSKLVYDNITTALKFNSGASIELGWNVTDKGRKPDSIELFVKPTTAGNYSIIDGDNSMVLWLSGSLGSEYGQVKFTYSGSNQLTNTISSSLLPIFNDRFFGIEVNRTLESSNSSFELSIRQADKERTIFEESISASVANTLSDWENGTILELGNNFVGIVDEFRLWSTPLDRERFYEHVSFPEMINGNHISSSTDDLYFRLDFEYPKNLAETSSLINVDTNIYFENGLTRNDYENGVTSSLYSLNSTPMLYASASGFTNIATYPYQFEAIDRSVVLEIPDLGSSRYSTNKVRFESQTDFSGNDVSGGIDLSIKSRVTKKSFDQSPTDSNRVGLFFSPTKELNLDIAKSFGGINLDNYIGDPSDDYKPKYSKLDSLRSYYFDRFDGRDIYAYINLIKLYEKSMFEDIKNMLPARVKATTGLLIEPHILERNKIEQKRPTADEYQNEANIKYSDTTNLTADSNQYLAIINSDLSEQISVENNQYSATIYTASLQTTTADSYQIQAEYDYNTQNDITSEYYQKEIVINAELGNPSILTEMDIYDTNTIVGQSTYENLGFGIYAQSGHAIRTYFDKENRRVKERVKVDLVTEQKERVVTKFAITASVNGLGDPRGGYVSDIQTYTETYLNVQPYSNSKDINAGTGSIVKVVPLDGYLSTHYRNTSDLTRGLQNSFFRGSKNTAATTLDGSSPIETFTSNPNTLKVNKAGRDASEPILEVE